MESISRVATSVVQDSDLSVREALVEATLFEIARDASSKPEQYIEQTLTPHGGE